MPPEPVRPWELQRMLLGDAPASFSLEVALRMVVLYAVMLIAMRVMGRRVASQLTRNELIAVVSLAAAVGPALASPDHGLLPPIVVSIWVVLMQRQMARGGYRSARFERLLHGCPATLLQDGRLDLRGLRQNAISRDALFATLRCAGAMSLGELERVYLEPDGSFSVLRAPVPQPGLTLAPHWDDELVAEQKRCVDRRACKSCGLLVSTAATSEACAACGSGAWTYAVS